MSPKICLVMIVRDEAEIIGERLAAIKGQIDSWCIVDTGSVDETVDIVGSVLTGCPGVVWGHEWSGFADTRTHALDKAAAWTAEQGGEWWALLLDADTIVHLEPRWRSELMGDVVEAEVRHGALSYWHPRLCRLGAFDWRYRGILHEFFEVPAGAKVARTDLLWVEHGSGGARSKDPKKYLNDAMALDAARASGAEPDLDARYCFYAAQSWQDAGEIPLAIDRYRERTRLGGYFQEVYMAWLRIGELELGRGRSAEALEAWLHAWSVDPSRAEALIGLASIMRNASCWEPAYQFAALAQDAAVAGPQGMFADVNVVWRADFEMSVAGYWVEGGWKPRGRQACTRVLKSDAPVAVKERTVSNLALYPPEPVKHEPFGMRRVAGGAAG